MSVSSTSEKIVLSSTSAVPLHERFTIVMKSRPKQAEVKASVHQLKASVRNQRLALQMEDRPSVQAALQHRSLKHRLGKTSVLARLDQPIGAGMQGDANGRRFIRGLRGTSRQTFSGFKSGFTFGGVGQRHGWCSVARQKLRSALRMQGGLGTISGVLVCRGTRRGGRQGRIGVGLSLDQGIRGQGDFRARRHFGSWRSFRDRGRGGMIRQPLVVTKEQLDNELDEYMSMSKSRLDAQLDAYMAMAGSEYMDIE